MSTATFSPIVPEMKMNGMSARDSRAIASALGPLNCGMEKSEMTRWGWNSSSSRRKSASVCTRWLWKSRPPRVNSRRTSSASFGLSSTSRILSRSAMLSAVFVSVRGFHGGRLVDDGPEHAGLLDGIDKLLETNRLDDVGVDSQAIALHEIFFLAGRRQHHDRQEFERLIALDLPQHLETVHLGHFQIEQHDAGQAAGLRLEFPAPIEVVERLGAVAGDDPPHVGEADARALEFLGPVQPLEHPEELAGVFHVEPRSVVLDVELQPAVLPAAPDPDLRHIAGPGIFDRVRQQVGPDLFQHRPVSPHAGQGFNLPLDPAAVRFA